MRMSTTSTPSTSKRNNVAAKTAAQKAAEEQKELDRLALHKRELIKDLEEWIEKIKSGQYTIDRVEAQAHRKCTTVKVQYPAPYRY
jgi:RNA polymerase-binding transcription factor DksA